MVFYWYTVNVITMIITKQMGRVGAPLYLARQSKSGRTFFCVTLYHPWATFGVLARLTLLVSKIVFTNPLRFVSSMSQHQHASLIHFASSPCLNMLQLSPQSFTQFHLPSLVSGRLVAELGALTSILNLCGR